MDGFDFASEFSPLFFGEAVSEFIDLELSDEKAGYDVEFEVVELQSVLDEVYPDGAIATVVEVAGGLYHFVVGGADVEPAVLVCDRILGHALSFQM